MRPASSAPSARSYGLAEAACRAGVTFTTGNPTHPMKQRDVQDADNLTWTCVQAVARVEGEAAGDAAAERVEGGDDTVPVVCTPSGGEQTLRVELPRGWEDALPDAELLAAIEAAREAR